MYVVENIITLGYRSASGWSFRTAFPRIVKLCDSGNIIFFTESLEESFSNYVYRFSRFFESFIPPSRPLQI